jgi:NitT/TauT family transport system substrate-binding protein
MYSTYQQQLEVQQALPVLFSNQIGTRYIDDLIPSLTETQARQHYERYVAQQFTVDGRHDPSIAAQAVQAVAKELGVSTVSDIAEVYSTEPAEETAA